MRVPGRVARTGIQRYLASELQLTDRKPDEIVNVYRPPEEVFSADSLQSYEDVDVTNDHPQSLVDASSFKKVAVGHTTDAAYADGEYVIAPMIIKDKAAIEAVESGKASLSAGYEAAYDYAPGYTEDGQDYEFVQRNIRINHIALVDMPRAGQQARLFDHHAQPSGGSRMSTVTLDGKTVEVADNATAQLIQSAFDAKDQSYKDMEAKAKEYEDAAKELREKMEQETASKDAAIEERDKAKQAASDEAINERIKAVSDAKQTAAKVAGADFVCDSVDPLEIKRNAMAKARPSMDWADKSEAYVQAAWDHAVEQIDNDPAGASHQRFADDLAKHYQTDDGRMAGTSAYDNFLSGGKH